MNVTTLVTLARALELSPLEPLIALGLINETELLAHALRNPQWARFIQRTRFLSQEELVKFLALCDVMADVLAKESDDNLQTPQYQSFLELPEWKN